MSHDPDVTADDENAGEEESVEPAGNDALGALETIQHQQRLFAALDFSAIDAVTKVALPPALIRQLAETVAAVQNSVNFSGIQRALRATSSAAIVPPIIDPKVFEQLSASAGMFTGAAANARLLSGLSLPDFRIGEQLATLIAGYDYAKIAEGLAAWTHAASDLAESFTRDIPSNLGAISDLDGVATLALDEGLPLTWVPRTEIVEELLIAAGAEERLAILERRFVDVLDDCEAALTDTEHEWAHQCRNAIEALRHGFDDPAQSHAGNIIDSIILTLLGPGDARKAAVSRAQTDYDDYPIRVAIELFTLRPLVRGFRRWFRDSGDPIPEHFARHSTAHAVGQPGVFSRRNALIAVMLATSLTRQFYDDPAAP